MNRAGADWPVQYFHAKVKMTMTAATSAPSDAQGRRDHNLIDTVLLISVMTLVTAVSAYQFLGWPGLFGAILITGLIALAAPSIPPSMVMRLYQAAPVDERSGRDIFAVVEALRLRAGLETAPGIYVIPSLTLNAFSAGTRQNAAIAMTEGLLRKLSLRQTAGVLAHEIAHIRNQDLRVMALADALSRTMQVLSWVALAMIVYYLPVYLTGSARVPWLGLILLYLAPTICTLLQLALARTREFEADRTAARLTGDPGGLASALRLIERYHGRFWEELMFPSARKVPAPSILRTHPDTEARIERLRHVMPQANLPPLVPMHDGPRISLVGMSPSQMRPRYRVPGIWF